MIFLKKLIKIIIHLISKFYSYKSNVYLNIKLNQIYSEWLSNTFKSINNNFYIKRPIYIIGGKYISIGKNFVAEQRLRLDAYDKFLSQNFDPNIQIGDNVSIEKDCHIACIVSIIIEDNVLIGSKVYISDHSHGSNDISLRPALRNLYSKGPVLIEKNVWIGEGVVVLPGVTIGMNSIIGANSVVTKSIPQNSVAVGNPAKVIRFNNSNDGK
jgi:acetyltransferase-like isoleucine patch superfamily enzyme